MTPQPTSERFVVKTINGKVWYVCDTENPTHENDPYMGSEDDARAIAAELNRPEPATDTITATVTWHRGGASGAPWPWGEERSPQPMTYYYHNHNYGQCGYINKSSWHAIFLCCDPADLRPPTFEERRDV